jgi:hypothetical protein
MQQRLAAGDAAHPPGTGSWQVRCPAALEFEVPCRPSAALAPLLTVCTLVLQPVASCSASCCCVRPAVLLLLRRRRGVALVEHNAPVPFLHCGVPPAGLLQ